MWPHAMELGWRRILSAAPPGGPAAVLLGAAIACGATAAMAQLDVVSTSEQVETGALVARMTVPPSAERRGLIDALIAGLKADGVWPKLDWLAVTAAHDAQAARLNWRASKVLAAVNVPAFTVDRGYAGDGATSYLDFGEAAQAGGQFSQNNASLGVWCNQAGTIDGRVMLGANGTSFLTGRGGGAVAHRLNQTGNATLGSIGWMGHRALVRPDGAMLSAFLNGGADGGAAAGSAAPTAANLTLLSWSGSAHANARIAAAYSGAALGGAEMAALHGRLNTYLTAIGGQ